LLLVLEHNQAFSNLWKDLKQPSPAEEEILDILLLMEASIWKIFEYDSDAAAKAASLHRSKQKSSGASTKHGDDGGVSGPPKATLRDAIEVLLETTPRNKRNSGGGNLLSGYEDSDLERNSAMEEALLDLEELLWDQANDLDEDDDDDRSQPPSDAITLAAFLWDRPGTDGKDKSHNDVEVEVRARRHGDSNILEISGLENTTHSSPVDPGNEISSSWLDENRYPAAEFIYSRVAGYHDHIPDITSQIYQHNGNRSLRYSFALEDEIYQRFRQPPPGYYYEDEEDFDG